VSEPIVSTEAESELDELSLFHACARQNIAIANRAIDVITARFELLQSSSHVHASAKGT
jgi:hypothetical protein